MDWHFKTNQRMTEAEKKGQHRSWYVDEMVSTLPRPVDEFELIMSGLDSIS